MDVLDVFPSDHPARPEFIKILAQTLTAVSHYQDKDTGLWWQILDQSDRPGNYLEASGSCMFVYAMAKGVRMGYLEPEWLAVANRAFNGLLQNLVTTDEECRVDLHGVGAFLNAAVEMELATASQV